MPIDLKVPTVGESVTEIFIGKWYKAEGDRVEADEPVVEVESEKATLDVPAPGAGVLVKILKTSGESAAIGEVIAQLEAGGAAAPAAQPPQHAVNSAEGPAKSTAAEPTATSQSQPQPAAAAPRPTPAPAAASAYSTPTSPREKWIIRQEPSPAPPQPARVSDEETAQQPLGAPGGSGAVAPRPTRPEPAAPQAAAPAPPTATPLQQAPAIAPVARPTFAAPAYPVDANREEETVPLSPIRRRIAARLVEAQHNAALLTTFNEIDMTAVKQIRRELGDAFQRRHGTKLGFMSFFVKAAIDALKQCPELNAIIDGDAIVYRHYYDIGVAIGSQRGLVVPVLRNAETLGFAQIEKTIEDFAKRAQSSELRVEELQGGTFTISNGGVYGSLLSTPIVNPPQSGVLGMHAIQDRPVAVEGHIEIRPMMYVALSYDHRIVDGREAVTFLRRIKEAVEAPTRMLLEV